ncbi:hypothetical protein A3850_002365 [Lewinella sp. 4G2]|nr:hypothetical protein A3850_002365 [Lewinella sp. 4G2]
MLLALFIAPAAAQNKIPLEAAAWNLNGYDASFITHRGVPALKIGDKGAAATGENIIVPRDVNFSNGTIEYDVELTDQTRFTSIHFRRKDAQNSEHFYLRSNAVGDPMVNSAIQYAAVLGGVNLWDLSGDYQSNATLLGSGWNHVKLVVRDRQLLAYVNDMETPALYVPQMDGDWTSGSIGFDGSVILANLTITPDVTPGLSPGAGFDPTHNDARYLRNWRISPAAALPFGTEPTEVPKDGAWTPIRAERLGLVNLSRRFGKTPGGERRITWLKTSIAATTAVTRRLDLGFSDEVYVYLNGKPLYVDKNLYNTPGMKAPRGRCSIENSHFELPLQEGDNELVIGVTNFFFGWGIVARLEDGAGLRY